MSVEVFQADPPARPYRFELLPEDAMSVALELLEHPAGDTVPEELDRALGRGFERALAFADAQAEEQRSALILLSELSSLAPEEMADRLTTHRPRFRSSELCRLLVDKSEEEAHRDPGRARLYSDLALLAAELIDREALPRPIWHDIQAETRSAVAGTLRLVREFAAAETAFAAAERHLLAGSGTLMVRAALLISKASLSCDLGRFEPGLHSIDQALSILRAGACAPEIARALVAKGRLHLEHRSPECALGLFEEALGLLEGSTDRALVLAAHHNYSACLCELERFDEANRSLAVASAAVKLLARPLSICRLRWLEGRCAVGAGRIAAAETSFLQAMNGWLDRGPKLSAALVALDLARLYGRQGRFMPLCRLIWPILPIFREREAAWRIRPITDRSW